MGVHIRHAAISRGEGVRIVKHRDTLRAVICAKNGRSDQDAVWVLGSDGPKESHITWGPDPPSKVVILRGRGAQL